MFGYDKKVGSGEEIKGEPYVIKQVVLTEQFFGTGSNATSLILLQGEINRQVKKGYRLHTITTTSSGSKGFLRGDKIQATLVFERLDMR